MNVHELTIFSTGHQFLEAPRWQDESLWASDFFAKTVKRFAADGSYQTVAEVEGAPSGLGFLPDGSALVVSQADKCILEVSPDGTQRVHADFSQFAGGIGNDMLVTKAGHAYVGNFGFALGEEDPKTTRLVHVDPSGEGRQVGGELLFPNGMAIQNGSVLLVAESNQRAWAQLDDAYHPDGIALDADGGVWFGNALTLEEDSGFYRVVEGGEITDKVSNPGAWSVACAFGGDNLDTLYMTCNTTTLEEFHVGKSSAAIATAKVGRSGAPAA